MGACCSGKGSAEEQLSNAQINKKMKEEIANQSYEHRILLLGPGDSGKTTILKQMRKIHGASMDSNVIDNGFGSYIREKIMGYMRILCIQSIRLKIDLDNPELNTPHRDWFANELCAPYTNHLNEEVANKIKDLWNDNGIKTTLKRRKEFQIPDNVEYFMDNRIDEIASDHYQVTFEDFLRIRMRTTGFSSEKFVINKKGIEHAFIFTDVGGQRSERSKWMNMIHDDIDAVVYVVAISEYDLTCFEDANTLRLDEALNLFKTIISNGFCSGKTVTLFFNKFDLFQKKLQDENEKTINLIYDDFPDDKNPRNEEDVVQYIYAKFLDIYKKAMPNEENKVPHKRTTSAIDSNQIEHVMQDVEGDLIKARLINVGF